MNQPNPAQWLAEVQALQRQVAELQRERERAYDSANNWQKLYDQEAQQRRRDDAIATGKIERLQRDLSNLRMAAKEADIEDTRPTTPDHKDPSGAQSSQLTKLKAELKATRQECKQLQAQIEAERAEHVKTRNSLTAALGDAVDLLSKERAAANLEKSNLEK